MYAVPAILIGLVGLLFIAVGVLGATGTLPRNRWVGYRLSSVVKSEDAWKRGHRAGAVPALVAGLVSIVCALGIAINAHTEKQLLLWIAGFVVASQASLIAGMAAASRAADRRG